MSGFRKLYEQENYHSVSVNNFETINIEITKFLDKKSIGIKITKFSSKEYKVQESFDNTLYFKNGRYESSVR